MGIFDFAKIAKKAVNKTKGVSVQVVINHLLGEIGTVSGPTIDRDQRRITCWC